MLRLGEFERYHNNENEKWECSLNDGYYLQIVKYDDWYLLYLMHEYGEEHEFGEEDSLMQAHRMLLQRVWHYKPDVFSLEQILELKLIFSEWGIHD